MKVSERDATGVADAEIPRKARDDGGVADGCSHPSPFPLGERTINDAKLDSLVVASASRPEVAAPQSSRGSRLPTKHRIKPMMLGAHCSATRDNNFGIDRAVELGCETAQIFGSNKLQWKPKSYTDSDVQSFREAREEAGLGPIFSHAIYLINLGAKRTKPEIYERSISSLSSGLQICDLLGLDGLVVHLGSNYGLGLEGVIDSVEEGLSRAREDSGSSVPLLLENTAGSSRLIGGRFTDFATVFDAVDDDRMLGVCIDTAHAFAFGYDLTEEAGLDLMLSEIDSAIGLQRVMALHLNDSKVEYGRNLDRHENLGQGHIGYEGISRVLLEPRLVGIPAILETPGFDGAGPDKGNLDIMRSLAGRLDENPEVIAKRAKQRAARKKAKVPVAKRVPAKAAK